MLAKVEQRDAGRQLAPDKVARSPRQENLAAVTGRADACRAVDVDAHQADVGGHRFTGMEAHAHPDLDRVGPRKTGQRTLASTAAATAERALAKR